MKTKTWNLLFVAVLTIAALVWAAIVAIGTFTYRPSYHRPLEQGRPTPMLVSRVVFVIVDGLRYEVSETMPALQRLRQSAAAGRSIVAVPSISQAAWTTLVSGARPEINGAVLFNAEDNAIQPIQVDHLFQLAKQASLTTALAGELWWEKMVPAKYLDKSHFVTTWDEAGDREATQAAVEFAQDPGVGFTLLYMAEYDEASDSHGAKSPAAMQAVEHLNANLDALISKLDWSNTVLIVTADHGQRDPGGHGGDERVVAQVPFIMAGARVRPGDYPAIQQPDIPATIAALLGLPLPRSGQGRILYEMLDVTDAEKAHGEAALVGQRLAQADAYLWSIKAETLPVALRNDVSRLDALVQQEKLADANQLGTSLLAQIAQRVARARNARINQGRLARLPVALVGLALLAITVFLNWRAGHKVALLLALLGVVVYHVFWLLRGQAYTISTLGISGGYVYVAISLVVGALLAVALGLVALGLVRLVSKGKDAAPAPFARAASAYCAALAGLLFLQAQIASMVNGALGRWNLVVPVAAFLLLLSLLQTTVVGVLSLATEGVFVLASRIRGKLTKRSPADQPTPPPPSQGEAPSGVAK
jgi:hypothetical protein